MQTLNLVNTTGRAERADAMIAFYGLADDLAGQVLTVNARAVQASTAEFFHRLLTALLIEREAESVHFVKVPKEVALRIEEVVEEMGMGHRVQVNALQGDPVAVTVSLTRLTVSRVERLALAYEDTKTDTINRAVALYDMLDRQQKVSGGFWLQEDGQLMQMRLSK